jgi:hypothetical protein
MKEKYFWNTFLFFEKLSDAILYLGPLVQTTSALTNSTIQPPFIDRFTLQFETKLVLLIAVRKSYLF